MNKCDLCPDSKLKNGVLTCPWTMCLLTKEQWRQILAALANQKRK